MGTLHHAVQYVDCTEPTPQSLARWRSAIDDVFPPVTVVPSGLEEFGGRLRSSSASALRVVDLTASGHAVERTLTRQPRQACDFFKVSIQLEGSGEFQQADRTLTLAPGSIAIYDTGADYSLRFDENYRFLVAMFPKTALPVASGLAHDLVARPIKVDSGSGSVFSAYMRSLAKNLALLCGAQGERVARAGMDLLTTLLSDSLELDRLGSTDATRGSLLPEIQHHIRKNLHDPALSPRSIADAHFISLRHLYNLLAPLGMGVSEWIKQQRLSLVRDELANPRLASLSVAQIADRCGFPDAAHFGKAFKAAYGTTPGAWRASMIPAVAPRGNTVHASAGHVHT